MKQEFHFGELVEIVGPRHKGFANEHSRDIGKLAIVIASYAEQFGGDARESRIYTIYTLPDEGQSAWHDASELKSIKKNFVSFDGFVPWQSCRMRVNP